MNFIAPDNQLIEVRDTGYQPREFQTAIHDQLKRFSVLVVHRRGGKTVLSANQLIHGALTHQREFPPPRFAYVAPFRKQAKDVAWDYFKQYGLATGLCNVNESELALNFTHNKSRVTLYGADNPDALRGLYFDGVVLDEVADMRPNLWGEIVRPTLADHKGWVIFIGTPRGINLFYDLYQTAQTNPNWYGAMYTVDDTDALDDEELELARQTMTETQWRQEMLCDFGASSDDVLITVDLVSDSIRRHVTEDMVRRMPRIIGVDCARFGGDDTIITKRQGLLCHRQIKFTVPKALEKEYEMRLAARLANEINQWEADGVCFDVTGGYGGGAADRLRQLGYDNIIDINFGSNAIEEDFYKDTRTEIWFKTRDWIRAGGMIPNATKLKRDLCSPTYSFTPSGQRILESKKDMKKRGLPSPDRGDSLALTFAVNFAPDSSDIRSSPSTTTAKSDYDPFEEHPE